MPPAEVVIFLTCAGIYGCYEGYRRGKRARLVEDTPRSKIATAAQGYSEFEGFAWPKADTFRTLRDQEAIYYEFALQKEVETGSGKNKRKTWRTEFSYNHIHPFYVVDVSGLAMVHPIMGEFEIGSSEARLYTSLSDKEKKSVELLVGDKVKGYSNPLKILGITFGGKFRVVEKSLLVGSPLYVAGSFSTAASDDLIVIDAGLQSFRSKVFNTGAGGLKDVTRILDKNNDGKVSKEEEQAGYTEAAMLSRKNPGTNEESLQVCGQVTSTIEHKLFIANQHERHLVGDLKFKSKAFLGVGLVSLSMGATLIFGPGAGCSPSNTIGALEDVRYIFTNAKKKQDFGSQAYIERLHDTCVRGSKDDCGTLFDRADDYQLSEENKRYYRYRYCELGGYCDKNERTPSSK